jgi:hypothetical protein
MFMNAQLQTEYRVYSAREQYQSMRKSAVLIQRWTRAHMKGPHSLYGSWDCFAADDEQSERFRARSRF